VVLGFPVALLLAWAFELTPEGIKRAEDVTPERLDHPQNGKEAGASRCAGPDRGRCSRFSAKTESAVTPRSGRGGYRLTTTAPLIPENRLPSCLLKNLSSDKENAYFAEGIQTRILTGYRRSRPSRLFRELDQKYKSAPDNLRRSASSSALRISSKGACKRSEPPAHQCPADPRRDGRASLGRKYIVSSTTSRRRRGSRQCDPEQLNAKLSGAEQKAVLSPTENVAADDAYLRGVAIEHKRYGYDPYREVASDYAEAVRLDPKLCAAWARLASSAASSISTASIATSTHHRTVKEAVDRAGPCSDRGNRDRSGRLSLPRLTETLKAL